MNHPTQTLPFHLNASIVKARIQEYLDAVSALECKEADSSTAPICIEAVRSVKSDSDGSPFTFNQKEFDSVKLFRQLPVVNVNDIAIQLFAKMVIHYAQKTNQSTLSSIAIGVEIRSYYENYTDLEVPTKAEIFKRTCIKTPSLAHTLAESFPKNFKEKSDKSLTITWH